MKRLSRIRITLWHKYLLSYLLVFATPFVILGFFIYTNAVKTVQNEVEMSNHYKLNQVRALLDQQILGMNQLAARMANDYRLSPYMAKVNDYYASETVKEIAKYKANSAILEELFLFFRGDDHIYSTEGVVSMDVLTKKTYRFSDQNSRIFQQELNSVKQITLKPAVPVALQGDREKRLLTYLFPVLPNSSNPYATVLFLIDESVLTNTMKDMLGNFQGDVYLLNEKGDVLAAERTLDSLDMTEIRNLLASSKVSTINEIGSSRYSIMSEKSEITGWSYVIVMPTDQFWQRVIQYKMVVRILLLTVLLVGLAIAVFLSFKQFGPIRSLAEHLSLRRNNEESQYAVERKPNELDWIRSTVDDIFDYAKRLEFDLEHQRPLVQEQALFRLLKGSGLELNADGDPLYDRHLRELQGEYYFIIAISSKEGISDSVLDDMKSREAVLQMLHRVHFDGGRGFGLELMEEQVVALVVSVEDVSQQTRAFREQTAEIVQQWLSEQFELSPLIGVGTACRELSLLNRSLIEGLAMLEYRLQSHNGRILFFEDISLIQDQTNSYSLGEQVKFNQSLKLGDRTVCLETLEGLLDSIASTEQSILLLRCVCFDMVNTVLKQMRTMQIGFDWPETRLMMEFQTLDDLRKRIKAVVIRICDYVEVQKDHKQADLCERIVGEITLNYRSSQLSLDMLSQKFGLSASYISRFVREQTGTTFTEYVLRLRVEAVKQAIVSSDRPIKEIILETGYQDMSNFIKKFKKMEGITPGEYRKAYSKMDTPSIYD
ncbi:AraC family transcriptional regulator [Paenibacillus sp. WQ 127069]|uniref:AraC family transcriptional regulator n=1 Tax=Paenibacillus baimaensis TaxID=2982185 RepID=A0ABT2UC71_9BACL|nr:AraC family transcriptional regulator [Paenibacillus sp. WQ 127069]MCU6792223.1 AraC family transcriptional regulator [Paenibacillus sp. WQ 127069]